MTAHPGPARPDRGPAAVLTPQDIVETALAASRADGCVVVVQTAVEANVRWANNTVTTSGVAETLTWFVVSVVQHAAGTVTASAAAASSAVAVAEVVRAAEDAARAAAASGPARDAAPLVEPGDGPHDGGIGAGDYALPADGTSFAVYADLLPSLAAAFDGARGADQVLYGFARHDVTTTHLGVSTGLRRRWVQPTGTVELNAKSADLSRSVWAGSSTPDFVGVDVSVMADSLGERLEWARRAIALPPGRYDTLLPPTAVADFMVFLAWSASAREAHEGRSAFAASDGRTRVGETLSDRRFSLFSDPEAWGLEAAPFVIAGHSSDDLSVFDNGAPIGRTHVIEDGRIAGLVHTRASAAEYGAPFTPAADNLVLTGGDQARTTADLVRSIDRGLLVTSQWYLREVDPRTLLLTGLTRDGVFLVERGEVIGAVNNFRFNVSPLDVLRQAKDVGRTEAALSREWSDWFTRSAMPPILVEGFNMSSVSAAQ